MTIRSVLLGVLLALGICGCTYYNDHIIHQTYLIGNHLPASVFGVGLLLLVTVNPLLRLLRRMPLRPGEIAVVIALGLAGCAWPGSNLMRYFAHVAALPEHAIQVRPQWQATGVMSYVPGASPLLAEGFVRDFKPLVERLTSAQAQAPGRPAHRFWTRMAPADQQLLRDLAQEPRLTASQHRQVTEALNRVLRQPGLYDTRVFDGLDLSETSRAALAAPAATPEAPLAVQRANRELLTLSFPDLIAPAVTGEGVLLGAQDHPDVTYAWLNGRAIDAKWEPSAVPWRAWWPVIRLWGGLVLLLALATLCLMLIVHPQWSQHEMLQYPTVEFVHQITRTRAGSWLPEVLEKRMFWFGFLGVAAVHLVNGLHAWFPQVPEIMRQFDFNALRVLFPDASRVPGIESLLSPVLYPCVIGFGFLITGRVAMSLGLSLVLWIILGAWLLSFGTSLQTNRYIVGANGPALRFGAYVAAAVMILYSGRRYYAALLPATLGFSRKAETPVYAPWAARGLVICSAGAMLLLMRYAGLPPLASVLLVLSLLLMFLVLARINAETGLFYAQPDWLSGPLIVSLFGASALGPSTVIVLFIAGMMVAADPREAIAPFLTNGLHLAERLGRAPVGRLAAGLAVLLGVGLVLGLGVTLTIQYQRGIDRQDNWPNSLAIVPFNQAAALVGELTAEDKLTAAVAPPAGQSRWSMIEPNDAALRWMAVGAILLLICAVARLRLAWWPLHPVLFLVWGTYPANLFAVSFLAAAAAKIAVVRLGGVQSYHKVQPLAIGLIAGDLLMVLFWAIIGALYYAGTGNMPSLYRILPS